MAVSITDLYDYISSTGIIIPDTSTVQSDVINTFKSILGNDIDTTPESNIGRLIEAETMRIKNIIAINAQNANQINPSIATGIYLDAIGALFGVARVPATKTIVNVKLTGSANTVIPQGSSVFNSDNVQFLTTEETTLNSGGIGYVDVEATITGNTSTNITTVQSVIAGWETVETESIVHLGGIAEDDNSFRERIINANSRGAGSIEAIYGAVYNCDSGVSSVVVLENGHGVPVVKHGVFLPPHSIYVCVYGGDDAKIAKAIYDVKTAGATLVNDSGYGTEVTETVEDERTEQEYSITFYRPVTISSLDSIVVSAHKFGGIDPTSAIKSALIDYITSKGVGGTLTSYEASTYITNNVANVRINYVEFADESQYTFTAYQIGIIDAANITVNFS